MSSIMACTVAAPTGRNETWATLQSTFLDRTKFAKVSKYVVINGTEVKPWKDKGYEVLKSWVYNKGHYYGLKAIVDSFRETEFEWLLILDSDAWPVRDDWFAICDKLMNEKNKLGCAAIRCENFDTFPHPCVFLAHRKVIDKGIEFKLRTQLNLLGEPVSDLATNYADFDTDFLPLIRTNRTNFHPLFGGIYGHLFYHHGAGSRVADNTRVALSGMYDHIVDSRSHISIESAMFNSLKSNPIVYLNKLLQGQGL